MSGLRDEVVSHGQSQCKGGEPVRRRVGREQLTIDVEELKSLCDTLDLTKKTSHTEEGVAFDGARGLQLLVVILDYFPPKQRHTL